ncbi:hypothetical protein CTI12_AA428850 [Artemisia annua]|uniref:Ulp1 protease family, C-terminal catalytic domain-containing protein n=1 Tax=Artemisia annua TaxID=35608 RepID=A0A2U1M4G6_ARTAN|nr:hypothetical protein CTI12_AA428850 [Artemisia annua]
MEEYKIVCEYKCLDRELRRSGRFKGKGPVFEENTIDQAIDADVEDSEDDFQPPRTATIHASGSSGTMVKWKRSLVQARLPDSPTVTKGKKGKKRASENRGMKSNKKQKGDRGAEELAGPSTVNKPKSIAKKKKRSPKKDSANTISTTLRTRSSPKPLYLAIATLKPNQQACIAKMGFGNLLDFKVDGIPSRLGFYVIDKFDPEKMEIKLKDGALPVNSKVISEMLGLKDEGVNIMTTEVVGNEEMIETWKNQYSMDEKDISPSVVKGKIRKSKLVDLNFKLNFVVLFANIFGCCRKNGAVSLEILEHITPDTEFEKINWCAYVMRSLPDCKKPWKKHLKNNFFCGPVAALTMIYVDGTKCEALPMVLREREEEEIDAGGLGRGEMEPPYAESEDMGFPEDLEGFVWKMGRYVETISKSRSCFENTLWWGKEVFPGNEEILELERKYVEGLRMESDGASGEDGNRGNTSGGNGNMEKGEFRTPNVTKVIGSSFVAPNSVFDSPEYAFGAVTQAVVIKTVDRVVRESDKGNRVDEEEIPSCSLGLTQDWAEMESERKKKEAEKIKEAVAAVPVSFCSPMVVQKQQPYAHMNEPLIDIGVHNVATKQPSRREQQASAITKSPFIVRSVDFGGYSSEERKIKHILFESCPEHNEQLFMAKSGHQSHRIDLESLGQSEPVLNNILDAWRDVLNYCERQRSAASPLRYFLPTFVVTPEFRKLLFSANPRFIMFKDYVEKSIEKDVNLKDLKGVELVFIPVSNNGHQFVVVFNIMRDEVVMLDSKAVPKVEPKKKKETGFELANRKSAIDIDGSAADDSIATILHYDFGRYLSTVKHPKAMDLVKGNLRIPKLKWQTASKAPNCGVFVMRHMETYMGEPVDKYQCGINADPRKQVAQLNKLRIKYAAKILLCPCNLLSAKILGMMNGK